MARERGVTAARIGEGPPGPRLTFQKRSSNTLPDEQLERIGPLRNLQMIEPWNNDGRRKDPKIATSPNVFRVKGHFPLARWSLQNLPSSRSAATEPVAARFGRSEVKEVAQRPRRPEPRGCSESRRIANRRCKGGTPPWSRDT
ncbi:hypothetical protein J6590_010864 [Homalodisca vitripennis]|nr:hypothetical protein J6590_010864 [Homalodisca vitripennis]